MPLIVAYDLSLLFFIIIKNNLAKNTQFTVYYFAIQITNKPIIIMIRMVFFHITQKYNLQLKFSYSHKQVLW